MVAAAIGIEHRTIRTEELAREGYRHNDEQRCYHCKTELYDSLITIARREGYGSVLSGANADDTGDGRPGLRAAAEHACATLCLRPAWARTRCALAHVLGLPSAEKPASPCLSSRLTYSTELTPAALAHVDRAEQALKALGFGVLRVRQYGDLGPRWFAADELPRALANPDPVLAAVLEAGYRRCEIDARPFRSGSLNRALFARRLAVVDGAVIPRDVFGRSLR